MSQSRFEMWTGSLGDRATYWRLRLTEHDMIAMDREQLEMIRDGLRLIEQALKRRGAGLGDDASLPVRT